MKDSVVVLREELTLPKTYLLQWSSSTRLFMRFLCMQGIPNTPNSNTITSTNGFALTAEEENSVVQWGIGRCLYAGALFAVSGLVLVALAEQVWWWAFSWWLRPSTTYIVRIEWVEW